MRYCPKCRAEYRDGFVKCADCEVPLVHELPVLPKSKASFVELEEVLSTNNLGEIAIPKSLLEGEKIPYVVQGENFTMRAAPIPVKVLVPREHVVRAREILAELL
jgi:hypothetical protein